MTESELQLRAQARRSQEASQKARRLVRFRRRWLILAAIVLAAIAYALFDAAGRRPSSNPPSHANAPSALPVIGSRSHVGDINIYITGLGNVTALNTVTVRTRVDGELIRIAFREGQLVHAGDLLALIDPRPFQTQLAQAEAQAAKDEATLNNARLDLQRYQALIEQSAIPRQQLDTQAATVKQTEAALAMDRAQIASARLNLAYTRITSPITGLVGIRLVDPGNIVHASDQNGIVVITQRAPIAVVFTVPEDNLQSVLRQFHGGGQLSVAAFDRDFGTLLASGTLASIDSQIDPSTGTIKLKATFANDEKLLFPNQFVNARLQLDTLRGVTLVPTAAIQHGPQDQTFVWVAKPDNTVEMRNVTVARTEGDQTAVSRGVSDGEVVVTDGVDKLQPGSRVSVRLTATGTKGPA